MKIAIVTGASSGLGREFVEQLDARLNIDEFWVIARRTDRLIALQEAVKTKIVPISLDLIKKEDVEKYKEMLASASPDVVALVNAAGYGKIGEAETLSVSEQSDMIALNVRALTDVTLLTLPYMQKGARIWQIASLSSYMPLPYLSVYAATKAYVLSFSRSLAREVKSRGVRVMAVCPGWMRTEFLDRAADAPDALRYYGCFYVPSKVVKRALRDMERGRGVSLYGTQARAFILLSKLLPHKLVAAVWYCLQK